MGVDEKTGNSRALILRVLMLAALLYGFFLGLDLMGLAFKLFGKGFAEALIARPQNPFVGLFIGILATTLVQSSSTTTSMTVALVAAGGLTIEGGIPIIMGANIGTSVTNTMVSLAHVTRREEFQRAFAGATVHDFFNWLAVLILLPLELATGYLAKTSSYLSKAFAGVGGTKLLNPLKEIVRPVAEQIQALLGDSGGLVLAVGVILLIVCLKLLVDLLKIVMTGRAEAVLHKTLFRSPGAAILAGIAMTVMVQSSSITTSVMIPRGRRGHRHPAAGPALHDRGEHRHDDHRDVGRPGHGKPSVTHRGHLSPAVQSDGLDGHLSATADQGHTPVSRQYPRAPRRQKSPAGWRLHHRGLFRIATPSTGGDRHPMRRL